MDDEGEADIVGDLTLRGVTREVTLEAEMIGHGKDPCFAAKSTPVGCQEPPAGVLAQEPQLLRPQRPRDACAFPGSYACWVV